MSNHSQELKIFLKIHSIDALLISETHFTSRSYFKIPGYTIYYTNHPDNKAHGGSAILIRSNIKHHLLGSYCKHHIQATNIVLSDWTSDITLSAIYCPPRYTIKEADFNDFFQTLGSRFIAGGDYNAKHTFWGSRLVLPRGRELLKCIQTGNLNVVYWSTYLLAN